MKNDTNGSAIVVGGSLSGLMTGIALAREGVKVTVVEKSGEDRPAGAGLQVDGGLFDRNKTARLLRKLASDGKSSVQLWSKIESNLRGEAKSDDRIDLRFDTRVQTVDQDDNCAWVVTDQGETIQGDILIGADGHRSVVRPHVNPNKPNATFSGYMVWFAAINDDELPKAQRPKRGPGLRCSAVSTGLCSVPYLTDRAFRDQVTGGSAARCMITHAMMNCGVLAV